MANTKIPRTRQQRGETWATAALVICGAFSIWANVRSGQLQAENVVVSVFPPIVAFVVSHLISYFNPRTKWGKGLVYGVGGLIAMFAMYGSGYHIVETVMHTGQPLQTAISYIFITDAPMLLAAVILAEKMGTARETTNRTIPTTKTVPAKKASPAKVTNPAKTTPPTKAVKSAPTKAIRTKSTQSANIVTPTFKTGVIDEEADMVA